MKRRRVLMIAVGALFAALIPPGARVATASRDASPGSQEYLEKIVKTEDEWRKVLTPEQFYILREAGTERPFSSALNDEKRDGVFRCAGCDQSLFTADMKFDSGTGWPSFFESIDGAFETKIDFKLIYPRTEYHCARCGGHHGHIFNDGPEPTGKRWCNNGDALKFSPA